MKVILIGTAVFIILVALASCGNSRPNQVLADSVDLDRFMGTWYVHGYTPTFIDKDPFGATETYELGDSGKIHTTYRYLKGGPSGVEKVFRPVGKVHDSETNAEWRMRFFGVINAPYYILYVGDNYTSTVVGHPNKELAWIMTRSPLIEEDVYTRLLGELQDRGYQLDKLERMQHKKPTENR